MSETNDNNSFLLTKIHIMGYNNKNARNGKSISTIAKLTSPNSSTSKEY